MVNYDLPMTTNDYVHVKFHTSYLEYVRVMVEEIEDKLILNKNENFVFLTLICSYINI